MDTSIQQRHDKSSLVVTLLKETKICLYIYNGDIKLEEVNIKVCLSEKVKNGPFCYFVRDIFAFQHIKICSSAQLGVCTCLVYLNI